MSEGTAVVALFGELDITGAARLREILHNAIDQHSRVEVELGQVRFVDSTVLSTFVNAHRHATAAHVGFTVSNPVGHVRRVLTMTRILPMLEGRDTR
uniref:STAS domain-containing protein n=1 Tax=Micromonospora acroterricola TaxID=2202421 RepID=UPI001374EF4A|nr:STAS domain-containing protein [Micromonospora acroterricola]